MSPSPNDVPGINLPPPATPAVPPVADTPTPQPAAPSVTDEKDAIEKEWVGKVKDIVERTHGDPYQQSQDLTMLKADYMKQRYNKIIKVDK